MSILIKGIDEPKNSRVCPFAVMAEDWEKECIVGGRYEWNPDRVCGGCPLVEVPTPHGRLVDASTKIEAQLYDEMTEEWSLKTMTVDDYLAFAADVPATIIEAEEGEEA